jgi:uncharacterized protein YbaR (Trm112 family)
MPISFRCPACRNKLSTARRKAGQTVACPNCQTEVQVPTADTLDPKVERLLATAARTSRSDDSAEPAAPVPLPVPVPPPPPPPTVARRPKPASPPPPVKLNDLPLFEREDFAEMLEKEEEEETPQPLPAPAPPPAAAADHLLVTRGTAVMVLVCVVLLVALAFAAGLMVGSRG